MEMNAEQPPKFPYINGSPKYRFAISPSTHRYSTCFLVSPMNAIPGIAAHSTVLDTQRDNQVVAEKIDIMPLFFKKKKEDEEQEQNGEMNKSGEEKEAEVVDKEEEKEEDVHVKEVNKDANGKGLVMNNNGDVKSKSDLLSGPLKKAPLGKESDGHDEHEEEEDEDEDEDDDEDEDEDEDEEDESEESGAPIPVEGMYDPAEYADMEVESELKELFSFITRYTPQTIVLETKFKPFIPEFIPAVGDIDGFIKVPRADGKNETLGLKVLDEPAAKQSDPSVLGLQLRAISKETSQRAVAVKKVEGNGDQQAKAIDQWIKDISDLHRSKPAPSVHYSRAMPDIDSLMQEWPTEVEEMLKEIGVPTADYDCDLKSYADISCALMDIPIHKSRIQSLHVLFSLYSAFKNSQHFGNNEANKDNNESNNSALIDHLQFD